MRQFGLWYRWLKDLLLVMNLMLFLGIDAARSPRQKGNAGQCSMCVQRRRFAPPNSLVVEIGPNQLVSEPQQLLRLPQST